jgi:hypothetical protein
VLSDIDAFVSDEQIKSNRRLTEVATALEGQLTALRAELRQVHPSINFKPAKVPAVSSSNGHSNGMWA